MTDTLQVQLFFGEALEGCLSVWHQYYIIRVQTIRNVEIPAESLLYYMEREQKKQAMLLSKFWRRMAS